MKYFVTGGAGFIGSNLVDRLLKEGNEVVVYDNFSTGLPEFLRVARRNSNLKIITGDILDDQKLCRSMCSCDFVFHLAANADIRHGTEHPDKDLKQNTIGTFNVLEAMRQNDIKKIAFSSTGSVYGECPVIPTPEDAPFPIQTSLYGASKLAGEGLIEAYCVGFGLQSWIFRFVSVLGERYTHGHVRDFFEQLNEHPEYLDVLGDGTQKKSYLNVKDCVDAIFIALNNSNEKINIFNLGTNDWIKVSESISYICEYLRISPEINYSSGRCGWIGDNPRILLSCYKIRNLGWNPKYSIKESIVETLKYLEQNKCLFETE